MVSTPSLLRGALDYYAREAYDLSRNAELGSFGQAFTRLGGHVKEEYL